MVIKEGAEVGLGIGMGRPELLVLLGLAFLVAGFLVVLLALLKALSLSEQNSQRAVGLILIGPFPILVAGRSSKLVLAILLIPLAILLAILLSYWAVSWP